MNTTIDPNTAAPTTIVAYCGGIDNVAAKGGFVLADGTTRYWVATRANKTAGTVEITDADHGITITRTRHTAGIDKIVAHCPDAVGVTPGSSGIVEQPRRRGRPTANTERLNCLVDRQALQHLRALAKLAGHGQYVGAYLSERFRPAGAPPEHQE